MRSRTDISKSALISILAGAVMVLVSSWLIANNADGLTFFFDEWDFLARRDISVDGLLLPHNGHLSTLPVLIYVMLRSVFGTDSYVPFQVVGIAAHIVTCLIAARMVHRRAPFLGIVLLPVLLLLGAGWQNILWPFQIGMIGALLFGLLAIDEAARDLPRARTVAWVCLSLLCAGGGVAVAGVVLISSLFRRQWRLTKLLAPVLLIYGVWYLMFGESQSQAGNLARTPRYVLDSAVWSSAGIGSWTFGTGKVVLGVVLVILGGTTLLRRDKSASRAPLLLLLMLLITWVLTGVSRSHLAEPQASRYVYVGAIVLVCCMGMALSGFDTWQVLPVFLCLLPFILPSSLSQMEKGAGGLRDTSFHVRSALAALDMTETRPEEDFSVDQRAPQLSVFSYDRLSRLHGRIGFSSEELRELPEPYRVTTDNMLNRLGATLVRPVDSEDCSGIPEIKGGTLVLGPAERLVLLSDVDLQIRPRRFVESTDLVEPLPVTAGEWHSIENHAGRSLPSARFELPLTGIEGCVLVNG